MAGLESLVVEAELQQGIGIDFRYGLGLDGILASQIRSFEAISKGYDNVDSFVDGGLHLDQPFEWELPLQKCIQKEDWHWMTTSGYLVDIDGKPVPYIPDVHLLLNEIDQNRARHIVVRMPQEVGGARGRFKKKLTPVLTLPAHKVIWHAVGDKRKIENLIGGINCIGARRNNGEGAVLKWSVSKVKTSDIFFFGHTHPDGTLGKPCLQECVHKLNIKDYVLGEAGLRPPLFHKNMQKQLAIPNSRLGI